MKYSAAAAAPSASSRFIASGRSGFAGADGDGDADVSADTLGDEAPSSGSAAESVHPISTGPSNANPTSTPRPARTPRISIPLPPARRCPSATTGNDANDAPSIRKVIAVDPVDNCA
ncbi:hypothetical protein GCM10010102_05080 [Promicromonospora citrea]|uniref:Uncharacterized protein n=1 Tax=Promicromonospora citrea TaxID=43677 RepID=A0A8H9L2J4_9MICO|nr:hypothetical protein GCM10010102_05080 [Promicromonospora citrea]